MLWVVVFVVIALAGLAMLIGYAVWLAHKTADLVSEVQVLAQHGAQLADLLGQIRPPEPTTFEGAARTGASGAVDVR